MMKVVVVMIIGCLSRSTGSEHFAFFGQWFCPNFLGTRLCKSKLRQYGNVNSVASRNIKGEMDSLPTSPKTLSLKLPMMMMMRRRMIIQV